MKRKDYILYLRNKTIKELIEIRKKVRLEYFNLKMRNYTKGLKETHKISYLRKNIARINTILSVKIKESYGSVK